MPHIAGHERGRLDPGLVRSADDAVAAQRGLPPPVPAPQLAPAPDLLATPAAPPSGGRASMFPTLHQEFGIGGLQVGQVPMAETEFNLRRRLDAERRRGEGLGVLQDSLNQIGTSEGEIAAREVALQRLRGGGLGAGAMRGQLAQEQEANLRALSEQFAQRGLGGGVPAVGMAEAAQRGRIGAASAEAAFKENLQRSALQDIQAMNQELGNRRLAATDLLQRYLGEWELPPVDLSALAIVPEDATSPVGGYLRDQPPLGGVAGDVAALPNPQDESTWEDGIAPEGHAFSGCRRVRVSLGSSVWRCPDGDPRNGAAA